MKISSMIRVDTLGLDGRKPVFGVSLFENNKGADQPVHLCRQISTLVFAILKVS